MLIGSRCNGRERIVKKNVQMAGGPAFFGSGRCEPLLNQEREEREAQECRAGRVSGRRRSARRGTQQGPVWSVPMGTVLVGTNVLLREGLARILTAAGFRILASTPRADDPVLSTVPQGKSILLIIDVSADFGAGLRQIKCFKERYPDGRVVVLADQHQLTKMVSAFRAGANAYLVKIATCETFVRFLELVMLGVTLLPPEILNLISDRKARSGAHHAVRDVADDGGADDDEGGEDGEIVGTDAETNKRAQRGKSSHALRLSASQQAVLRCLAEGYSNKAIARKMAMVEGTVKVHVKAILRKIRVHNRTQAAIWAMSNDPIPGKDDAPPALAIPPVEQRADLDIGRVQSEGCKNGSTLLTAIKLKGSSHITAPGALRLVRESD
jgi:two-component system nitrate/nitrite response regulator NarL